MNEADRLRQAHARLCELVTITHHRDTAESETPLYDRLYELDPIELVDTLAVAAAQVHGALARMAEDCDVPTEQAIQRMAILGQSWEWTPG